MAEPLTALQIKRIGVKTWTIIENGIAATEKGENAYTGGAHENGTINIKTMNGATVRNQIPFQIISYTDTIDSSNNRASFTSAAQFLKYGNDVGFFVDGSSGSGAATSFIELEDTFPTYIGREGQALVVNESATGIDTVVFNNVNVSTDLADFPSVLVEGKYLKVVGGVWQLVDGIEGEQNNVGRKVSLGYTLSTSPTVLDIVNRLNLRTTVVSETDTPVIVFISTFPTTGGISISSKTYPYLFLPGKGTYGVGGTTVTASMLYPFAVLNTTPDDIESDPNNEINNLDPVVDGDFVTKANQSVWPFTDSTYPEPDKNYYFTYTDDGVLYFALFVGEPGVYGTGGIQFTEDDFVTTTNSEVEPELPLIERTSQLINDGETGDSKYIEDKEVYKYVKVEYPKDMTFRPFNIYENEGVYNVDLRPRDIVKDKISKMKPYYVNYQTGSNSNNGLTESTAFKTIAVAYASGARLIYLTGGIHKIDSWGTLNSSYTNTDDCFIIGTGKEPTIICSAPAITPTITLQSGTTYQSTDANIRLVVDMKYVDSYGYPLRLNEVFSVSSVNNNMGSYYFDTATNTLYFNLTDGRVPDTDVLLLTRLRNAEYRANAGYHYVENITFMGGGSTTGTHGVASQIGSNSTLVHLGENCRFIYGQALNYTSNGGEGCRNLYNKLNWFYKCKAYSNARDGFNYLSDTNQSNFMYFIEFDCQSFENDWRRESNNTNGSSFHGGGFGIRVNSKAYKNSGPNYADVDGAVVWNINCFAAESTAPDPVYNSDFAVETNPGLQPTKMYIYDCVSLNTNKSYSITGTQPSYIYSHPINHKIGDVQVITPSAPQEITEGEFNVGFSAAYSFPPLSSYVAASGVVSQTITNGVTTSAPSEDAVFDALALKANLDSPVFTNQVTFPNIITITGGSSSNYVTGTGAQANLPVAVQGVTIGTLAPSTTPVASGITFKEAINRLAGSKQDILVAGTNIKNVGGQSLLGSGNITSISLTDGDVATTQPVGNNSSKFANTAFVQQELAQAALKTARGSSQQSGNGTSLSFNIPHGLGVIPSYYNAIPTSAAAGNIRYFGADATNIIVYYSVAPTTGTNNLSWNWIATKP